MAEFGSMSVPCGDAEGTKHDPSNGRFTGSGGSSGGGAKASGGGGASETKKKMAAVEKTMRENPTHSKEWKAAAEESRKLKGELYEHEKSEHRAK